MITTIRASSLPSYSDCARRWAASTLWRDLKALGYEVKERMPKSVGTSIGTGTHGGVAYLLSEKMTTGELGGQRAAEECAIAELESSMKEEGVLWDETTPNLSDAQRQTARMVRVYRETVAKEITPVSVERRLEANLGDGYVLSGQADVTAMERGRLRDTKTGRLHRTHYAQLGSYSLLGRTRHPEQPIKEVCTDFIPRVALKKEQPLPITEFYDQGVAENAAMAAINHIKYDIAEFRKRIADDSAPPEHSFLANPGSMLCSARWCPAHGTEWCKEHAGAK